MWAVPALVLLFACTSDWRSRKISNVLCVGTMVAGTLLQAVVSPHGRSVQATLTALEAIAAMYVMGWMLWRVRLFGAGDAKLLMALAPFVGLNRVPALVLLTLVCGGVLALVALGWKWAQLKPLNPTRSSETLRWSLPYSFAVATAWILLSLSEPFFSSPESP
jgi:Flp pilus assembly protein protease CpaA